MGKNTVKKLSNDLRKIASRKMKQITDLDQLEKQINEETINWTGKAREEKLGKEMSIAKIENEAEIKQMLRTFDRNLQKETHHIVIENIKNE